MFRFPVESYGKRAGQCKFHPSRGEWLEEGRASHILEQRELSETVRAVGLAWGIFLNSREKSEMQRSICDRISFVEINDRNDLSLCIDVCVSVPNYMSIKRNKEGHKLRYENESTSPGELMGEN